jgi:hypothetical protein
MQKERDTQRERERERERESVSKNEAAGDFGPGNHGWALFQP